ncbi:MAG: sugar phosphate nucleotidyltransferase, partial [Pyrinomonadaceae bacterium]
MAIDTEKPRNVQVLIMAAGLGTRMKSGLAKVLHKLDGRPLINHVCEAALKLKPQKIYVIVGHQAHDVEAAVLNETDRNIAIFALQKEQLGTGDAVNAARGLIESGCATLVVLSGDVPLIRSETLSALEKLHHDFDGSGAACTILSVRLDDPSGYGRVVRSGDGSFVKIVEQKDASDEERKVDEINSGIYCFDSKKLFAALSEVKNENAQGEYYLTDVPQILRRQGEKVAVFQADEPREIEGVNDRRQLA